MSIIDNQSDYEALIKDLVSVMNEHCLESLHDANVPDFILARVAWKAINNFCKEFKQVCDWYDVELVPGESLHCKGEKNEGYMERKGPSAKGTCCINCSSSFIEEQRLYCKRRTDVIVKSHAVCALFTWPITGGNNGRSE